ncbi:MAG: glycosyltransferase family 2 protein, partial [Gemmataceae bacterium]
PRLVPAVSAACLLIARDKFEALGGFDERLPVTYNDVDLCIRAGHRGWKTALSPHARLLHYEGLTRGFGDDTPGRGHLAGLREFPTGAGAWPGSTSTASD